MNGTKIRVAYIINDKREITTKCSDAMIFLRRGLQQSVSQQSSSGIWTKLPLFDLALNSCPTIVSFLQVQLEHVQTFSLLALTCSTLGRIVQLAHQ